MLRIALIIIALLILAGSWAAAQPGPYCPPRWNADGAGSYPCDDTARR